jgi:hypothetical protein
LTGPTTIAAPPTYSLNIPGIQNANNYNGLGNGLQLSPPGTAVASATNVVNGWQPQGAFANSTVAATPPVNQVQNPTANQTTVVAVNPPNRSTDAVRLPQNPTPRSGSSFVDSTNFRTTAVDERRDESRLPVTDASQVRAPANFNPATIVGQFNAPYYVPAQQQFQNPPTVGQPNPNLQAGVVNGNFRPVGFSQAPYQTYPGLAAQNTVLGQSTVYADPANDPNFQNGWRNRELTAGRDSFNR